MFTSFDEPQPYYYALNALYRGKDFHLKNPGSGYHASV